ncbi:MAG: hypothetical protein KGO49_07570 [Gammaproteobacteria bacterium]|nr:hypothetical protein [Gammaproteobacteria bacterium]
MQNHDIQLQPKIPKTAKIVFGLIAIFSVCCVFMVWYKTTIAIKSAHDYQPLAVAAMQKECALHCAQYDLTQADFTGPTLEHVNLHKNASNYSFSWSAARKNMQLVVQLKSTGSVANTQIETQWISLGTHNQ